MKKFNSTNIKFDEATHTYEIKVGRKWKTVKGITTVIREQLFPHKFDNIPEAVLNAAAERGTAIHQDLNLWFTDRFEVSTPEAKEALRLLDEHKIAILESEKLVTDCENYASAIDLLGQQEVEENTQRAIIDIKTSAVLDTEFTSWQTSIYRYFLIRMGILTEDENIKLYAIHLPKEGKAKLVELKKIPSRECENLLQAALDSKQYELPASLRPAELALTSEVIDDVANTLKALETLKNREKEMKEMLLNKMIESGVKSFKCEKFILSVKPETTRQSIDNKILQSNYPEIYSACLKSSKVNSSLTIKLY